MPEVFCLRGLEVRLWELVILPLPSTFVMVEDAVTVLQCSSLRLLVQMKRNQAYGFRRAAWLLDLESSSEMATEEVPNMRLGQCIAGTSGNKAHVVFRKTF